MKNLSFVFFVSLLSLTFASFVILKNNTISVYINGKTIPENTVLTHEQDGSGITLRARIPSGARFNELIVTLPATAVGTYPIAEDSKAKIAYSTTLGSHFSSQSQNSKGFIKVVASTGNSLQIEFECAMASHGQKLALKTGKVQVSF
jgi:hypothetical protein